MCPGRIELIEHTADVAVRVRAGDLAELFELGARGLYRVVGTLVGRDEQRDYQIKLTASSVEDLFHDWLAEILYYFDVRQVVFDMFRFNVLNEQALEARLTGRTLDVGRSHIHTEVKAVTYHDLRIERRKDELVVTVVFDV